MKLAFPTHRDRSGRTIGEEEWLEVQEVLRSGTLAYIYGKKVRKFELAFAEKFGVPYGVATSSGTAALHAALIYLNTEPGDEIIVSPITDMGTVIPILYQGNIPVFVDIDEETFNIDPTLITNYMTPKTKAIIVTHIFGAPCDMDPIMKIAMEHNIAVIEDCAQAFLARYKGQIVGTIGDLGCFSLQQSKHITTGDGGMVIAKKDRQFGRELRLCADKGWPRDQWRDHLFLAPNYHMTELQAAVGLAQLQKLDNVVRDRRKSARLFSELLGDEIGVYPQRIVDGGESSYFSYTFRLDPTMFTVRVSEIVKHMNREGFEAHCGYLDHPLYGYKMLRDRVTFGKSGFPLVGPWGSYEFQEVLCPIAERHCRETIYIVWNEFFTVEHVEAMADTITKVLNNYRRNVRVERKV